MGPASAWGLWETTAKQRGHKMGKREAGEEGGGRSLRSADFEERDIPGWERANRVGETVGS